MPSNFSAAALAIMLVVGLGIGGAAGYFAAVQVRSSTSITTSQTGQPNLSMLAAALKNSQNATLTIPQYEFGKGSLVVWVTNNASSPIVLAPQMFIYNGTFQNSTFFTILDPKVIQYGVYAYIPPGSQIIAEITPSSPPLTPSTAILQIFKNQFTFTYGSSKL